MGSSPDAVCFLTEQYGDAACHVEFKTSKHLHPNTFDADNVNVVQSGSDQYYRAVPKRFRTQLLHGAAVLGVRYALLIQSAPTYVSSCTLTQYSQALLHEYKSLVKHDLISSCFKWLHMPALAGASDAEIVNGIPSVSLPQWRRLIASHVPVIAAVCRYRARLSRAIPPTKLFRFNIVNIYDIGKAPCDTFCKAITDMLAASSFHSMLGNS
jgi:hypothetical protein